MARDETFPQHGQPRRAGADATDREPSSTVSPSETQPSADRITGGTADFGLAVDAEEPDVDPLIGADLDGIIIERLVGQGGMGRVYQARQTHPSRPVAVKLMRSPALGPEAVQRFRREADALARLRHPGIAQIYLAGCHRIGIVDVPYFVLEFIPGADTLVSACTRRNLGPRARLELLLAVCEAVAHGHDAGIVHRDLKPGNILVDAAGSPKIIDFGIARMDDADGDGPRTETGHLMGTRPYMAPEQFAEGRTAIDARTDVHALGLMMHEVLAGRLPYDVTGKSLVETALTVQRAAPSRLAIAGAGRADGQLVRGAAAIADRCLRKDPAERYPSATELAADLRAILRGDAPAALTERGTRGGVRFGPRSRLLVAAVTATCVAATILTTLLPRPLARRPSAGLADSMIDHGTRSVGCRFPNVSSGRTSPLAALDLGFDEDVFGLGVDDFRLERDGEPVSIDGLELAGGPRHWRIGGLAALTAEAGQYTLSIAGTPASPRDRDGRVVSVTAQAAWRSPPYREIRVDLLDDAWDRHVVSLDGVERYTESAAGATTFIRPTVAGREGSITLRFDLPFTLQDATLTAPLSVWTTGDPFPYDPGARAALDVSADGRTWETLVELRAGSGGSNGEPHDISRLVAGGTSVWVRARLTATREWPKDGLIFSQFLRTNAGEKEVQLILTATGPHPPVIPGGGP